MRLTLLFFSLPFLQIKRCNLLIKHYNFFGILSKHSIVTRLSKMSCHCHQRKRHHPPPHSFGSCRFKCELSRMFVGEIRPLKIDTKPLFPSHLWISQYCIHPLVFLVGISAYGQTLIQFTWMERTTVGGSRRHRKLYPKKKEQLKAIELSSVCVPPVVGQEVLEYVSFTMSLSHVLLFTCSEWL